MGTARARVRDSRWDRRGFREYPTLHIYQTQPQWPEGWWEECSDVIGNYEGDNPFTLSKRWYLYPRAWGEQIVNNAVYFRVQDYVLAVASPPDPRVKFVSPNLANLALEAAAKTNPSAPHVSLPSFFGEAIEDLPNLLQGHWIKRLRGLLSKPLWRKVSKGSAKGILKRAAHANLSWRFFWRPLYHDLKAMVDFVSATEKRLKYLNALATGRSVKRRVHLGGGLLDDIAVTKTTLWSERALVTARRVSKFQEQLWASCSWRIADPTSIPRSFPDKLELAQRLVLGLTSREAVATAWELFPWSWLADWFVPIGSWIAAMNNTIPVHLTSVCVMRKTSVFQRYTEWEKPSWFSVMNKDAECQYWVKERWVVPVILAFLPLPSLPILTNGQLSILGSLAALKGLK